jgi:hypothetical protein
MINGAASADKMALDSTAFVSDLPWTKRGPPPDHFVNIASQPFSRRLLPMSAPTPDGRLLCASHCAYAFTTPGPLMPDADGPFYDGAGFIQPPAAFLAGPDDTDACLVGRNADGVLVAFRGTLSHLDTPVPTVLDWVNDFNALPVATAAFPGKVHSGFLLGVALLWPAVCTEVMAQLDEADGRRLHLTGHSKGGGMAPLAALLALADPQLRADVRVVTFAAPRAGDQDFAAAYNARVGHTRYEYADDLVPHLPPQAIFRRPLPGWPDFAYASLGKLRFIDWSLRTVADRPGLELERRHRLLEVILSGRLEQFRADHSIECGSGYVSAVCPSGVCS